MSKPTDSDDMSKPSAKWANDLDSYMRYRAHREGVGYDLSPEFFEALPPFLILS